MTVRNYSVNFFYFIIYFVLIISLTPISMFADGYEPDYYKIRAAMKRTEELADTFSTWAESISSGSEELVYSLPHARSIYSVAYSPDGNYIITGSQDKTVKLWDKSSRRAIRTFKGHSSIVYDLAITPDGKKIISGSNEIIIWDILNGNIIHKIDLDKDSVKALSISPDGKTLVCAPTFGDITLWDIDSGSLIRSFDLPGIPHSIEFSPDGRYILTNGYRHNESFTNNRKSEPLILIYNVSTGNIEKSFSGHEKYITSTTYSPDGKYIASCAEDNTHILWNAVTGQQISKVSDHKDVNAVAFTPDGNKLLTTGVYSDQVKVWDPVTGEFLYLLGPSVGRRTMGISPDGESVFIPHYGEYRISDAKFLTTFNRGIDNVKRVKFSPDNKYLISGSEYSVARLWEFSTGRLIRTFRGSKYAMTNIEFSADGKLLATTDGDMKIWNTNTGECLGTVENVRFKNMIFSSDSRYIFTMTEKRSETKIIQYDIIDKRIIKEIDTPGSGYLILSPNEKTITLNCAMGSLAVIIYNLATGGIVTTFDKVSYNLRKSSYSPDGNRFASGTSDNTIQIRNTTNGGIIRSLKGHLEQVVEVIWSHDGRYIASRTRTNDRSIKLWNAVTGDLIRTFEGTGFYKSLIFSPDDHFLLATDVNNIKKWNVSNGQLMTNVEGHALSIISLEISSDGKYLVSSGFFDGILKLWDLNNMEEIFSLISDRSNRSLIWSPEGYFMGNETLAKNSICIVEGLRNYSIDQFFETYYRPDIIQAKIAGKDISKLIGNNRLADSVVPTPKVIIEVERSDGIFHSITNTQNNYKISDGSINVKVTATDQGGGAEEIRLFHNGVRASGTSRGLAVVRSSNTISQTFSIQLTNGDNALRALAFTTNRIESTPSAITISYTAPRKVEPTLWVLAVGINEYKNGRYNLNYAVNDAESFVGAVKKSGESLFKSIEATLLTDKKATRLGIIDALEAITDRSKPEDVFMFFYAGHGIALESAETERTEFFFIPTDVTQMTDLAKVMDLGLAGPEFEILVSSIPARKQFLVLDACNSGAINTAFGVRGAAEEIALSRLSRATGSALIAASRDDQFAQEFAALGQGALTKAILDGLGGNAALGNGQITVGSLKSYVESALPGLTEQYAGRAQYPTGFVFGQDFPIGVK